MKPGELWAGKEAEGREKLRKQNAKGRRWAWALTTGDSRTPPPATQPPNERGGGLHFSNVVFTSSHNRPLPHFSLEPPTPQWGSLKAILQGSVCLVSLGVAVTSQLRPG